MIIPNDINPSWTNQDILHAQIYTTHRMRLWMYNYCASLWPQIFSWTVINIYPASSEFDYRYDSEFYDNAILVDIKWDNSGKGCENSSCYKTYPRGKVCTEEDSPVVFPSGNFSIINACNPACFARRRTLKNIKKNKKDISLTNQTEPTAKCIECEFMDENVAYKTKVRQLNSTYREYDQRNDKSKELSSNIGKNVTKNENNEPNLDADMPTIQWDEEKKKCTIMDEMTYRTVIEPYWRDPSHSKCKLTNFHQGDDVIYGFRANKYTDFDSNMGFLVKHSTGYCRAFGKNLNKEGNCDYPWWHLALSYTIAGDGIIHWIRNIVEGEWECKEEYWNNSDYRDELKLEFSSKNNYNIWRTDINKNFKLPPGNVLLSDLGIDSRLTGNRLYWNNVEGIISQFAMFTNVEELIGNNWEINNKKEKRYTKNNEKFNLKFKKYNSYREIKSLKKKNDSKFYTQGEKLKIWLTKKKELLKREINNDKKEIDHEEHKKIDDHVKRHWNILKNEINEKIDEKFNEIDSSIDYNTDYSEAISFKYLKTFLSEDSVNEENLKNENNIRNKRSNDENNKFKDILDHYEDSLNVNKIEIILKELSIGVGAEIAQAFVQKMVKKGFQKVLLYISKNFAGKVTTSLLKVGIRVGFSKIIGLAASRLTVRLMIMIGACSTVVGAVLTAISLISLIFDIAEMLGVDFGGYNNEEDIAVYVDVANTFAYGLYLKNQEPFEPYDLMMLLTREDKNPEDLNKKDNVDLNDDSTKENIHVDEDPTVIKWFNNNWPQCFKRENDKRLELSNSENLWTLIASFHYLGSLTTNSLGQKLNNNTDEEKLDLNDENLTTFITEAQYRDILTVSAKNNIENYEFNDRIKITKNTNKTLLKYLAIIVIVGYILQILNPISSMSFEVSVLTIFIFALFLITIIFIIFLFIPIYDIEEENTTNNIDADDGNINTYDNKYLYLKTYIKLLKSLSSKIQ